MCTAVSIVAKKHYFGRNLDNEHTYGEKIAITPRRYPFVFRNGTALHTHYAMIGTALVYEGYPLYFDALNEKGLAIAGLNFPNDAVYQSPQAGKENVASFEVIPWVLAQCANIKEAKTLLENVCITNEAFRESMPPTPLHWMLADKKGSLVLEQTKNGAKVFENPVGVLTNSPDFEKQMFQLNQYMHLSVRPPHNTFSDRLELVPYSKGMGALGMPGDFSSMSRFVKACFIKCNSSYGETELENVCDFFHLLGAVHHPKGVVLSDEGFEITTYSCCFNTEDGIYYYTTYYHSAVYGVSLYYEDLSADKIVVYDRVALSAFPMQNQPKGHPA